MAEKKTGVRIPDETYTKYKVLLAKHNKSSQEVLLKFINELLKEENEKLRDTFLK